MTGTECRRIWQAEAARDGRLSGGELRNFELHAAQCTACARERGKLERLANALRVSGVPADEVALRRVREQVLQDAYQKQHDSPRSVRRLSSLAVGALGALLAFAAIVHRARHHEAHLVEVSATPNASWERRTPNGVDEVRLKEGTFTLTVHRGPRDPRVVVLVPDGEIDDIGTVFEVTVTEEHTRSVVVREGAVVLKLSGEEPVFLRSSSSWVPAQPNLPIGSPSMAPPVPAAATPAEPAPAPAQRANRRTAVRRESSSPPSDALSNEDLAYLRIVALRREGRADEARVAAAEYLRSFPEGFRRIEVLGFLHARQ
ncbi:MAG TPA: FecR domain-containing protein [Polyangiaceae bacterium]|nr:FecR domain-containing protein [Polyangiaceae bacterium]